MLRTIDRYSIYKIIPRSLIGLLQIVSKFGEKLNDIHLVKYLKEILVAGCYASVNRYVSADSSDLLKLLPLTTVHSGSVDEKKVTKTNIPIL